MTQYSPDLVTKPDLTRLKNEFYNYVKTNMDIKPDFEPTRNQPDDPNEHL